MSVDVFGRVLDYKRGGSGARGPPGEGFQRTPNGDFDINRKRLCNVAAPLEESDASTYTHYVDICRIKHRWMKSRKWWYLYVRSSRRLRGIGMRTSKVLEALCTTTLSSLAS